MEVTHFAPLSVLYHRRPRLTQCVVFVDEKLQLVIIVT